MPDPLRRAVAALSTAALTVGLLVLPAAVAAQPGDQVTVSAVQQGQSAPGSAWAAELTVAVPRTPAPEPPPAANEDDEDAPPPEQPAARQVRLERVLLDGQTLTCPTTTVTAGDRTTVVCRTASLNQSTDPTAGLDVTLSDADGRWTVQVPVSNATPFSLSPDLDVTVDFPSGTVTGDQVTATIRVTNTGDTTFSRLDVTSDRCTPASPRVSAAERPGGSATTTCSFTPGSGEIDVTVTGRWTGPDGAGSDTWTASGTYRTATAELSATTTDVDLTPGGQVTYRLTARNTGDVPLAASPATIGRSERPACALGTIQPGATATTTCTVGPLPQTYDPTAPITVTFSADGVTFTESTPSGLGPMTLSPDLDVTLDMPTVPDGTDATATVTIDVEGDTTFDAISVTVPACPNQPMSAGDADPDDTLEVTCDYTARVSDPNTVQVVATYPTAGGDQTVTYTATTDGAVGAINLQPRHDPLRANTAGGPADALLDVIVTGVAPVTDVTVTSTLDGCDAAHDQLGAGTTTLTCAVPTDVAEFTATVTATIGDVTVEDTTSVSLIWFGATLDAHVDPSWDRLDRTVPVNLTVTNDGTTAIRELTVRTDPFEPSCRRDLSDALPLAPGEHTTVSCTRAADTWPASSARPAPQHAASWVAPGGLDVTAHALADDHAFSVDDPVELDLDGTIEAAGTTADDRRVIGLELDAVLLDPARFEQDRATFTCPYAEGCERVRVEAISDDGGAAVADPAAAGVWEVTLTAPRGWKFAANDDTRLEVGRVEVLPGRDQFDPSMVAVPMVADHNPLLRLSAPVIAVLGGLATLFGLVFGWRHATTMVDPPWA